MLKYQKGFALINFKIKIEKEEKIKIPKLEVLIFTHLKHNTFNYIFYEYN